MAYGLHPQQCYDEKDIYLFNYITNYLFRTEVYDIRPIFSSSGNKTVFKSGLLCTNIFARNHLQLLSLYFLSQLYG
jgi:hypothetical protein